MSNNYFAYYLKYKHFKKELISIKPMYALIENSKKLYALGESDTSPLNWNQKNKRKKETIPYPLKKKGTKN